MSRKRNRGNGEGSIFKRQDGGPWYITWYDHAGKRREHCTKTTDKTTAQRIRGMFGERSVEGAEHSIGGLDEAREQDRLELHPPRDVDEVPVAERGLVARDEGVVGGDHGAEVPVDGLPAAK